MKKPLQPFVCENDIVSFKKNSLVCYLLDHGGIDLNNLAVTMSRAPQEDWEQFYQLIGYSLCGYHELSNVSDESALAASRAAKKQGFDASGCRDTGCEIHCGVESEKLK